jgi:chromosome segregation ATPase
LIAAVNAGLMASDSFSRAELLAELGEAARLVASTVPWSEKREAIRGKFQNLRLRLGCASPIRAVVRVPAVQRAVKLEISGQYAVLEWPPPLEDPSRAFVREQMRRIRHVRADIESWLRGLRSIGSDASADVGEMMRQVQETRAAMAEIRERTGPGSDSEASAELQRALDELEAKGAELLKAAGDVRASNVQTRRRRMETGISDVEAKRGEMEIDTGDIEAGHSQMESGIRGVQAQREEIEKEIRDIHAKRDLMQSEIAAIQARRDEMERGISSVAAQHDEMRRCQAMEQELLCGLRAATAELSRMRDLHRQQSDELLEEFRGHLRRVKAATLKAETMLGDLEADTGLRRDSLLDRFEEVLKQAVVARDAIYAFRDSGMHATFEAADTLIGQMRTELGKARAARSRIAILHQELERRMEDEICGKVDEFLRRKEAEAGELMRRLETERQ